MKRLLLTSLVLFLQLSLFSQTIGLSFGGFLNSEAAIMDIKPVTISNLAYNWLDWDIFPNPGFSKTSEDWLLVNSSNRFEISVFAVSKRRFFNYYKISYQKFNFNAGYLTFAYDTRDSSVINPFGPQEIYVDYSMNYGKLSVGQQWDIRFNRKSKFAILPVLAANFGFLFNQNMSVSSVSNMQYQTINPPELTELSRRIYFGGTGMLNLSYDFQERFSLEGGLFIDIMSNAATQSIEIYRNHFDSLASFGGPVYKSNNVIFQYGFQIGLSFSLAKNGEKFNKKGLMKK